MHRVIAHTTNCDHINEWVVEVDGVRRARFIGHTRSFLRHVARMIGAGRLKTKTPVSKNLFLKSANSDLLRW